MPRFETGQTIKIKCRISPGPFSDEPIVTIDTVDGPVSGFVSATEVTDVGEAQANIKCTIAAVEGDILTVWIKGSFFTTNGLATVERSLAQAA